MTGGLLQRFWVAAALLPLAHADGNCTLTHRKPKRARYLKFCQDYNTEACCIPGHDLENQVQFENLIDGLGPGCKNPMMYPEIRFFYCLGCDPKQPDYTDLSANPPEIRICKSFLEKLWRDPAYEDCGVMASNECPHDQNGQPWDFDPFQCGDTLVLPKWQYGNDYLAFINAFKPPGMEEFNYTEVDDLSLDASGARVDQRPCWTAKSHGSSNSAGARLTSTATLAVVVIGMVLQTLL